MHFIETASGDPYGNDAAQLLRPHQSAFAKLAAVVSERFYTSMSRRVETRNITDLLNGDGFVPVEKSQAQHLQLLLSPDLTVATHRDAANRVGRVHALVGVDISWLIDAYGSCQSEIYQLLCAQTADSESREMLMCVISKRFLLDLNDQVASYRRIDTQIAAALSQTEQYQTATANLPDLVRGMMTVIGRLDGEISIIFARVDAAGALQIEESHGPAAERYHKAMETGQLPRLSVDPAQPGGLAPSARAWCSGKIVVSDTWKREAHAEPWGGLGRKLGLRSSAAVPLVDEAGRSVALIGLCSAWPKLFSTPRMYTFLRHIQRIMSESAQRCIRAPAVPLREQYAYRRMLDDGAVVMLYQPIVSLRDGRLLKVEALARLQGADGELISPRCFLPALGRDELFRLFVLGLRQACGDCRDFEAQGLSIQMAINFPAEGFGDPRYQRALVDALESCALSNARLQLEVMESRDVGGGGHHHAFIQQLRTAGIRIAHDDLGSGHSSLLRLDQYPFDEVKIDQGLVRGAARDPRRAVEFILHLTQLAHAFDIPVTVEGLETTGLIEAAAILGVDQGQGYGIAEPMVAGEVLTWHQSYQFPIRPLKARTALGAMAGYLLWDLQLTATSECPELVERFVGAKTIIDEYIAGRRLEGGALEGLLQRDYRLATARDRVGGRNRAVRTQILEQLVQHWREETA